MEADADFTLQQTDAGPTARLTGDWTATRLAMGAAELRDMVIDAWRASATGNIGYMETAITPAQAESGEKDAWLALWGDE